MRTTSSRRSCNSCTKASASRGVAGLYYLDAQRQLASSTQSSALLNLTIATSGFVDTTSYAAYADFS